MEIGILGTLEVRSAGRSVQIAGSRLRALITRLAIDAPGAVSTAELVDAVWPDGAPAEPVNALQSLISRVRRALGEPGSIQQVAGGYRLAVDRGAVDATAFSDLVTAGRRALRDGATVSALDTLVKALSLWRGDPLVDGGDAGYVAAPIARLTEQRLDAQADRLEAELLLGRGQDVIADLEALATAYPLRERFAGQLMRALAAAGRTADALAAYERVRDRLADELGVDPGPEVQALQLAVLRGEIAPHVDPAPDIRRKRSNLRSSLTSFIGREDEVARVSGLLTGGRLVTIVGPGGAGKTRLANEVAGQWVSGRADGVWLVELAPVTDGKAIPQAMLGALGLLDARAVDRRVGGQARDSTEYLFEVLADADCLLLVDNCEHLIGPVADLIDRLLAGCPNVRILTTSREPLGIVGEALCLLPPLGLPPVGVSAADAVDHPAVRLLIERAQAVSAGFSIDDTTVAHVTEIVRRLDGLPLAIELAAARLRVMPIGEIAARLSNRFRLLTGGSRTAMPRHRTLRAVVEWSWDLLAPDERLLAERLAVFPAGATVDTAVAICGDDLLPAADIGDLLLALVDKSLLTMIDGPELRYRMLETIREYGTEQLADRGEARAARTAHAYYFAAISAEMDPVLRTADQLRAIETLRIERDNILAGLRFLAESDDPADRAAALDLALSLSWYWTMIGANSEASIWLGMALNATDGIDHPERLWAEAAWSLSTVFLGMTDPGVSLAEVQAEMCDLARRLGDAPDPHIIALGIVRPMLAFFGGDVAYAESAMESILQSSDGWYRAAARVSRALFAENEGNLVQVRIDIEAAHEDFAQIGDRWGLASVLSARGTLRAQDGDLPGAIADYETALHMAMELGSMDDDAFIQLRLAGLRLRCGDSAGARRLIEQVRSDTVGRTQGLERGLFADGILIGIELHDGNLDVATAMAQEMRVRLAQHPPNYLQAHAAAVFGATSSIVAARVGDLDLAMTDLLASYPLAMITGDMPIMAAVGVSVGWLAFALGLPADAATVLGAAARLRGTEDRSDPVIAELTTNLRAALGEDFAEMFGRGMALDRPAAIARLDPQLLTVNSVEPESTRSMVEVSDGDRGPQR